MSGILISIIFWNSHGDVLRILQSCFYFKQKESEGTKIKEFSPDQTD